MADLKKLTKGIAQVQANKKKPNAPLPRVDTSVQRAVEGSGGAIVSALREGFASLQNLLGGILRAQEASLVDVERIGEVVAREIRNMPEPKVVLPERAPVSYRAVFERNASGAAVGARIDPVT